MAASRLSPVIRSTVGTDKSVWKKLEAEDAACWYSFVIWPVGKGLGPSLWLDAGSAGFAGSFLTPTPGSEEDAET